LKRLRFLLGQIVRFNDPGVRLRHLQLRSVATLPLAAALLR